MALANTLGYYALGDTALKVKFNEIIQKYGITTVIETGIHEGKSTLELSYMVDKVIGIEILEESIQVTKNRLDQNNRTNYELFLGSSPDILKQIMPTLQADRCIFFLDAHWWNYWPVNDEINSITKNEGIIILHDFVVPERPDLYYDSYVVNGINQKFDYEFVKDSLTNWSPNHRLEYNSESFAQGGDSGIPNPETRRGVGFLFSK
jgi:SAM-dependent methyltransferase